MPPPFEMRHGCFTPTVPPCTTAGWAYVLHARCRQHGTLLQSPPLDSRLIEWCCSPSCCLPGAQPAAHRLPDAPGPRLLAARTHRQAAPPAQDFPHCGRYCACNVIGRHACNDMGINRFTNRNVDRQIWLQGHLRTVPMPCFSALPSLLAGDHHRHAARRAACAQQLWPGAGRCPCLNSR